MKTMKKQEYEEMVAKQLREGMLRGDLPWLKPWQPGELTWPYNATTGNQYHGFNVMWLLSQGYNDPRWATFYQANKEHWKIIKDSKSSIVIRPVYGYEKNLKDENGNPVLDEDGKPKKINMEYDTPRFMVYHVFNGTQIDGIPEIERKPVTWEADKRAERILANAGVAIHHDQRDAAYYNPHDDSIHMPDRSQFPSNEAYYGACMHELCHWTGHSSRFDRDMTNPSGSEEYAKEELNAEIAAFMVCTQLGLGFDPHNSGKYVEFWAKKIESEPDCILKACAIADDIADAVLGLENEPEKIRQYWQELKAERSGENVNQFCAAFQEYKNIAGYSQDEEKLHNLKSIVYNSQTRAFDLADSFIDPDTWTGEVKVQPGNGTPPRYEVQICVGHSYGENGTTVNEYDTVAKMDDKGRAEALAGKLRDAWKAIEGKEKLVLNNDHKQHQRGKKPRAVAMNGPAMKPQTVDQEVLLTVPPEEWADAGKAGAVRRGKEWFAQRGADLNKLSKWIAGSTNQPEVSGVDLATAHEELAGKLVDMGADEATVRAGGHPIFDGPNGHRLKEANDKQGGKSMWYVAFADENGYGACIQNHRTGKKENWKARGYVLNKGAMKRTREQIAKQTQERKDVQNERYAAAALAAKKQLSNLKPATQDQHYLQKKGCTPTNDIYAAGKTLCVPGYDPNGELLTIAYYYPEYKGYFEGARKHGAMHPIGLDLKNESVKPPILLITEGYATGNTVHQATGIPTVVAFDGGNIKEVCDELREKYPDALIVICADNDKWMERDDKIGYNKGLKTAREAADKVGGYVISPVFPAGEQERDPRNVTDFNDLARIKGENEVSKQVKRGVYEAKQENNFRKGREESVEKVVDKSNELAEVFTQDVSGGIVMDSNFL